jgi:hypothetical protein
MYFYRFYRSFGAVSGAMNKCIFLYFSKSKGIKSDFGVRLVFGGRIYVHSKG